MDGGGWASYYNSVTMAGLTALFGTAVIFTGAYLLEKTHGFWLLRAPIQFAALLPLAVPGLVLGLGYIFFFNSPDNPFRFLYGTMAILVLCTIARFYPVAHLTATTALKQIDPEFETVSASLRVPLYRTFPFAGLPARRARDRDVLVRERDDDGLGRGLPLRAPYHACSYRRPEHG
jgi:iron(III) transport system permease protein